MMFKSKYSSAVILGVGVLIGFFLAHRIPIDEKLSSYAGCNQIARYHADLLMREYGIEFNTDSNNPNREINQKAGDLNGKLLEICNTDPTK